MAGAEALPLVRVSEAEAALTRRLRLLLGTLGGLSLVLALLAVAGASFASADVTYPTECAAKSWVSGDLVYLCFVKTRDPKALQQLQPRVSTT